jgi:molecular chaperone HscB
MRLRRKLYSVTQNYFELFGVEAKFDIELNALENNYRQIQAQTHPDRFVTAAASEKLRSMQQATLANEAYQTLKNSANRAKYLLELQGITAISETNTAMPTEFLMQQMEWREVLEDGVASKSVETIESLLLEIKKEVKSLQLSLIDLLDIKKDYNLATDATRKLIFLDKVSEDIKNALELLD